ncbi:Dipeptidyl peptidase IV [Lunatimonas lonarensis]|uniref:Dipeptidyl peptidase IV n=1 Tax=Lunatimonas lonarensis TaxID=1232681 RepID=R7ZXT2_9BACT|nr:S9 family peptidase [Lunatimonas lonarensis]EON78877.1 Dipeptidyl peptidase IV [Lunatimonas lonarensis]
MARPLLLIVFYFLLASFGIYAQGTKKISLEDIFKTSTFTQKTVEGINWMADGKYYSALSNEDGSKIWRVNLASGESEEILVDGNKLGITFSDYSFSPDESFVLLISDVEKIYRRSSKALFYVFDRRTGEAQPLLEGEKVSYATLSPDNTKVAFVKENNLFYKDLSSGKITQVTRDGKTNEIINGAADWVYEEEFSMAQAFDWSPKGDKLAFIRFDESEVPVFNMQMWGDLYPTDFLFKYPKAGEANAKVSIHVFHLDSGKTTLIDAGEESDIYLPRIYWTGDNETLAFIRLNRLQNEMDLLHAASSSGDSKVVLNEKSNTYVDLDFNDNLQYLSDNKSFITTSERDGFKHIYHFDMEGTLIRQITAGPWEVTNLIGIDQKGKKIYFESTEASPLERHLYVINFNGKGKKRLSEEAGTYSTNMSPDFKFYISNFSSASQPLQVSLHDVNGRTIKVLETNEPLRRKMTEYALGEKEFFSFNTIDGTSLNGYLIKPADFVAGKRYPVLMYVYGGPGSQNVRNAWGGIRDFWHQHLAAEGYLVACVDNRGTGGRGRDFKHSTYANLGKLETEDQIAAAKYLGSLPFVDSARIGIWGWSYGGYMSSLSLMLGNDVFKTAIAVAPVTTWRYYDTIYTERYLQTPQLNARGYDDYSPMTHVDKLKGNYLIIHGTGDDNVHFQNAVDLVDALIAADKQFESFYYPNRNHGIRGGNTTWHLYNMMTDFIKRKL